MSTSIHASLMVDSHRPTCGFMAFLFEQTQSVTVQHRDTSLIFNRAALHADVVIKR